MKNTKIYSLLFMGFALFAASCSKLDKDLVEPNTPDNLPQILVLADEGDGDIEDADKFSFKITLLDRIDPTGEELGGVIVPLSTTVRVQFQIDDIEGFAAINEYILSAEAFYEIDDCTTSLDSGIDLNLQMDFTTGIGSVDFPAGVEEIEIEFETEPTLFDDSELNADSRELTITLLAVENNGTNVVVNSSLDFKYEVLDDETIFGSWEVDLTDSVSLSNYLALFSLIEPDLEGLTVDLIDKIEIEFEYGDFKAIVVLKELEEVDDCGTIELVNKEIEIEGEFEDLSTGVLEGDLEFAEKIEQDNGFEEEFVYSGSFVIVGDQLELTLTGEYKGDETDELVIIASR
jgi:hypothetical protein